MKKLSTLNQRARHVLMYKEDTVYATMHGEFTSTDLDEIVEAHDFLDNVYDVTFDYPVHHESMRTKYRMFDTFDFTIRQSPLTGEFFICETIDRDTYVMDDIQKHCKYAIRVFGKEALISINRETEWVDDFLDIPGAIYSMMIIKEA